MMLRRVTPVLAVALASCSAGGLVPPSVHHTAAVKIVLRIPQAKTGARARHYVSPGTKSVVINGYGFDTIPSSPNCSSVSGGLQCSFAVESNVGDNQGFGVTAYDEPLTSSGQPQGNQLSTGGTYANVVEGQANVVKITLLGTPGKATMSISDTSPPMGTPASIPLTLNVYDADGYAIVGEYSSALQLTAQNAPYLSFTVNGQTSLAQALVTKPSDVIAVAYSGFGTASGTINANVQFAPAGVYLASIPFTPHPAFGAEMSVGTSLMGASAWRDSSYEHRTWFTEPAKHKVATYPVGGPIAELASPSGASLFRLTATPTYIYSTESTNSIALWGTGNTTGTISEHALSSPNVGVYQIGGSDSDFNIYFTEKSAGKIGKLSGSGNTFTEFTPPNPNSTPAGMAWFGGTAWLFADPGANAIGIVTNAGGFTYYPVPTAGAKPTEIAGDGWFTEPGASQIGHFDGTGGIKEYASPGIPTALVPTQSDLFVLTTSGKIEDYDPSTGSVKTTYTPPASANGPAVGIFDGQDGSLIVLRSDGTNGSIQPFYYI